jgi:hypothetical protein
MSSPQRSRSGRLLPEFAWLAEDAPRQELDGEGVGGEFVGRIRVVAGAADRPRIHVPGSEVPEFVGDDELLRPPEQECHDRHARRRQRPQGLRLERSLAEQMCVKRLRQGHRRLSLVERRKRVAKAGRSRVHIEHSEEQVHEPAVDEYERALAGDGVEAGVELALAGTAG